MNYALKKVILVLIISFSCIPMIFSFQDQLTIHHPTYFGEQNNIFESIHYLENELLSFEVCPKDKVEISSKVICSSGEEIEIELYENEQSCYYANKNFNEISCSDFTLHTSYIQDEKERTLTRKFEEEKESKLLNHILEKDYTTLNSLDLSYYLLTLNKIQDQLTQETIDAYEKLKNDRNNNEKCWPQNNCNLLTTAKILNNINLAQYSEDSRLLEDGKIFFENKIVEDEEIEYTSQTESLDSYEVEIFLDHKFGNNEEIECDLNLDFGDEERSYIFDEDSDLEELRIYKSAEENIDFNCNEDVDFLRITTFEETISEDFSSNEDRLSHELSESDKDDYSEFILELSIKHEFSANEEIECSLEIDGDTTDYTFDEDSTVDEFRINQNIEEEFDLDCDEELDELFYIIYAGEYTSEESEDTSEIEFEIDSNNDDTFEVLFELSYEFDNDEEILTCEITTDDSKRTQTFDEDDLENNLIIIDKYSISKSISISCDKKIETLKYSLFDKFGREQISDEDEDIASKSYSVPNDFSTYSCISSNNNCDFETTLFANNILESNSENKNEIENFLKSYIKEDSDELIFVDETNKEIEFSGKYLYYFQNEEIEDSLKFVQNNDGSWGDKSNTEKILETSWASLGLSQRDDKSEYLEDARKWVYFNEPSTGWGSIEKNTLAYLTIEEQIKPYLKISTINTLEDSIILTIENPTIFSIKNIEITFGNSLNEKLAFKQTIEELNQGEQEEINITLLGGVSGLESGELIITGFNNKKEIEFITIPISLSAPFPFSLESNEVKVIEGDIFTKLPITSPLESFSNICTITNPFENRNEQSTITQDTEFIQLSNLLQKTGEFTITFTCESESGKTFEKEETFSLTLIPKTFTVETENINMYNVEEEFSLSITNSADDKQTVDILVTGDYIEYINATEASKILAFNETREVYFSLMNKEKLLNRSTPLTGSILLSSGDYQKEISIYVTPEEPTQENSLPWIWIIVGIIIIGLSLVVVRRYNQMNLEQENQNQGFEGEDELFLDEDIEFK